MNDVPRFLRVSLIAAAALLVAALVVAVVLVSRGPARSDTALGPTFKYDLNALRRVDPALIVAREEEGFKVEIPGPAAMLAAPSNTILVGGADAIVRYGATGERLAGFKTDAAVTALALDESDGNIVAAFRDRVSLFTPDGRVVGSFEAGSSNAMITGLAIVGDRIVAADAGNRRVIGYGRDGRPRMSLGGRESEYKEGFVIPSPYFPLQNAGDGTLWVVDTGRHRFVNFTPDGRVRASWEKAGMAIDGFCGCCNPTHFALREDGSFVTSEKGLARVKIHGPDGGFVGVVAPPDAFESDARGLVPAVDETGRILVLDPQRGRVRVFRLKDGR